ncbi:UNVERIFIED_CONTAM: PRA1 family protein B3 [Sesamum latifolium]|uniref:PRA1 family protein B3 n=1 Tax=Sesamum latifolium TaxID=2727402 RepID=A0AAW2XF66_9LAMI
MASAPTLPISNPQSESQPPIATPAFRAFLSRLNATIRHGLSQRRPWLELVDRSSFSRPDSLSEAASRIARTFLSSASTTSPSSPYLSLSLSSPTPSPSLSCYPSSPPGYFSTCSDLRISRVGSVLISALLVGLAVVCAHGAFRMPEDLFLDDQEPANSGFLSFLGGAASSAAAAAAPVVATRV